MRRAPRTLGLGLSLAFGLACFAVSTPASAAPSPSKQIKGKGGTLGLGLTLGSPSGLSLKKFFSAPHALQANLGWGPLHHGSGKIDLSYLWHPATIASNSVLDLVPYLGVGVGFAIWGTGRRYGYCNNNGNNCFDGNRGTAGSIFFRLPALGLAVHWQKAPLDTVLEGAWTPGIDMWNNNARFGVHHGDIFLGVRYYF